MLLLLERDKSMEIYGATPRGGMQSALRFLFKDARHHVAKMIDRFFLRLSLFFLFRIDRLKSMAEIKARF